MNNPFSDPGSASDFDLAENLGKLLVIEPKNLELQVKTSNGPKDAVRATITNIESNPPEEYTDVLLFSTVIVNSIKGKIGELVLGRLSQGQAKPGQKAPWVLVPATEQEKQYAVQWLQWRQANSFTSPTPAPQPQAPAPQQPQLDPWAAATQTDQGSIYDGQPPF